MENLGAMAESRYTGFCEITDRDVLDLYCTNMMKPVYSRQRSQGFNHSGFIDDSVLCGEKKRKVC